MLSKQTPDFNSLYLQGADIVPVEYTFNSILLSYLMQEVWHGDGAIQNPIWDREYHERHLDVYKKGKQPYLEFFQAIVKEPYFDYWRHIYGEFDEIHVNVNKVDMTGEMDWHFDGYDGTFLQILAYPNLDDFIWDDGGHLLVGRPEVLSHEGDPMPHWSPETSLDKILTKRVDITKRFVPNNDHIVVLNNIDPSFVHKVTKLKADKSRHTVIATLGFKSLWEGNKIKSRYYKDIKLI